MFVEMAWQAMSQRHTTPPAIDDLLPMDLSDLLDSFSLEARPERRCSIMLTEQVHLGIDTLVRTERYDRARARPPPPCVTSSVQQTTSSPTPLLNIVLVWSPMPFVEVPC